jgi:hypothetical protein
MSRGADQALRNCRSQHALLAFDSDIAHTGSRAEQDGAATPNPGRPCLLAPCPDHGYEALRTGGLPVEPVVRVSADVASLPVASFLADLSAPGRLPERASPQSLRRRQSLGPFPLIRWHFHSSPPVAPP